MAWNSRNSSRLSQQNHRNTLTPQLLGGNGNIPSKPSGSRAGRSSSLFTFGSKKANATEITPFTPNFPDLTVPQQPSQSPPVPPNQTNSNDLNSSQQLTRPSLVSDTPPMNPAPVIQREIKSVVDLALALAHKIYYSGPLIRRVERLADGNKPALDEGWVDVWAQLGGTTLSVWDMKAIEEASKRGEEVPPSYINITDCFVQVLGALTSPATPTSPSRRYTNVITINTAGSNLIFFACPSSAALVAWATSIRLAGWEKSRLEEIYTGHLLRMTLSDNGTWREPPRTLSKGRLEGTVKARISGHTDWKTFWMSVSLSTENSSEEHSYRPNSPVTSMRSKRRMSSLFGRNSHNEVEPTGSALPVMAFYASPKPKDRKKPLLTMRNVTQAYAVYPERPEVIQKSTLIKIEGHLGTEDVAGPMKGRECWIMIMPETQEAFPVLELVKWLVAVHDFYNLYGRPEAYTWDPRLPVSMWFGYPVGPQRENLFVSREEAERLDPRDDRTSSIRTQLTQILIQRMYSSNVPTTPTNLSEANSSPIQPPQQKMEQTPLSPPPPVTPGRTTIGSVPSQMQRMPSPETRAVSAVQLIDNTSESSTQAPRNIPSPPLKSNAPTSTGSGVRDRQSFDVMSLARSSTANTTSATSFTHPATTVNEHPAYPPPLAPMNPSPSQNSITSKSNTIGENQQSTQPGIIPSPIREGSVSNLSLAYANMVPINPQQHATILPLHPRTRSPEAISPPRSPPLPPTPKQSTAPHEIKQPVPLNAKLMNSATPAAANINDLVNEPAALYVIQETAQTRIQNVQEPKDTWNNSDNEDTASNPDYTSPENNPRRSTPPSAYKSTAAETPARGDGNTRVRTSIVGRKPSGARARPRSGLVRLAEFDTPPSAVSHNQMDERSELPYDDTVNALAAFNFLESQGFDVSSTLDQPSSKPTVPAIEAASQSIQTRMSPSPAPSNETPQYKSSFALSRQAAERQAKVQAQQEARHQPGKPKANGGAKSKPKTSGAWAESSEEEDDDDDEEEDEDGSDVESSKLSLSGGNKNPVPEVRTSVYPSAQPDANKEGMSHGRILPQTPNSGGLDPNRGIGEDRRRTSSGDEPRIHTMNPHTFARQSVWSSVLDPTPPPKPSGSVRNTFVQVDESETMTKAFQPQGLLSAGLQDREDRSARRQEEVARETGASLINVPSKPPPPQSGLLGAITAHERERKREGGVGAALTERERERRLAEERQRKLDELQRQQLDQMSQQGGMGNPYDMYGQQGFPGFMPNFDPRMSMNPMMLNPLMGLPTMPFANPQQNFAAMMAAQQAYHQAMLSFSQAGGSQAGDISTNPTPGMTSPLVPQMTGMSSIQPPMMGMDPRMSMAFNSWMMNPGMMGMNPGATGGMGMNFPGMANMGISPNGGLDPRMSGMAANHRQESSGAGLGPGRSPLNTPSSRQGSPAPPRSSNNSPLPPSQS